MDNILAIRYDECDVLFSSSLDSDVNLKMLSQYVKTGMYADVR